jgi:hypothetical protein
MRAKRENDYSGLVNLFLGRVDIDRLKGGYAVASRKNVSGGSGQRVIVQYSADRLEFPTAEEFKDTVYLLIPSNWNVEDIHGMDGHDYPCHKKNGAAGELTLRVEVDPSRNYL